MQAPPWHTTLENLARVPKQGVPDPTSDEVRHILTPCIESPAEVSSGHYIRHDFEEWVEQLTEIRYTQFMTAEMALEALQSKLEGAIDVQTAGMVCVMLCLCRADGGGCTQAYRA